MGVIVSETLDAVGTHLDR